MEIAQLSKSVLESSKSRFKRSGSDLTVKTDQITKNTFPSKVTENLSDPICFENVTPFSHQKKDLSDEIIVNRKTCGSRKYW